MPFRLRQIVLSVFVTFLIPTPCFAERGIQVCGKNNRIALVIGNSNYKSAPLENPVNDARDMAFILRGLGFEVIHKQNVGLRAMEESIRAFGIRLCQMGKQGVGLFYFAGHGMQVNGHIYLVPVDAEVYQETDVKYEAVNAGRVLDEMHNSQNVHDQTSKRVNGFDYSHHDCDERFALTAPVGSFRPNDFGLYDMLDNV